MTDSKKTSSKRINLRTPVVMETVQAQVESHYQSELVDFIRENSNQLVVEGKFTIRLAKEFGFCYGVERAIDLAYAARKVFKEESLFLIGEIIHNPEVNNQIRGMGIKVISEKDEDLNLNQVSPDDIVIIPAFGTDVQTLSVLKEKGCRIVDTTCGDVMRVWKRVRQYAKESFTSIIHGKSWHEETKATSSRAISNGNGHFLVVYTLEDADLVCDYILKGGDKDEFLTRFEGAFSSGFDPDLHLKAIGVANQTTMLRGETEEVQLRLKNAMIERYGLENLTSHFKAFETICGATQDRQDALTTMLNYPLDLLLVVGGYNSSNTSHLAEIGQKKLPTYFIKNSDMMPSEKRIIHFNLDDQKEVETEDWLPAGQITVGITAGASCPNNLIEDVIRKIFHLKNVSIKTHLNPESTPA
ncbi:MAG TPA: 4-hydroxy-3-methylbut-2-enyl diphosphate reductase [Verrucomicrobiales bacterium]|nr:4-hydroxy-3-methylbut-2-enyl diphosphate reductase [Verrucomicrobiales bacterium]